MKKPSVLIAVITALFVALLLLPGCDNGTEDKNTGGPTMTWTGSWRRVSDTTYRSNAIGDGANTIERLNIQAAGAGTLTIQITASSQSGWDYGYASKLDTGVSTSDYQMRVTGIEVATYTYNIPSGSHWIQFMYQKQKREHIFSDPGSYGSDSVTVEITAFTSSTTNTKLKVQNQSSVTLSDVKWGNTVVSASLTPSESKTVDVAEGSGYLYFTKGSAAGLKCRTQEVITVNKDETKELTLTDNTLVVALDDTNNPQALGTIEARVTQSTLSNQSFTELTDVIWNNVSFNSASVEKTSEHKIVF
jgi:hypothetical protein